MSAVSAGGLLSRAPRVYTPVPTLALKGDEYTHTPSQAHDRRRRRAGPTGPQAEDLGADSARLCLKASKGRTDDGGDLGAGSAHHHRAHPQAEGALCGRENGQHTGGSLYQFRAGSASRCKQQNPSPRKFSP